MLSAIKLTKKPLSADDTSALAREFDIKNNADKEVSTRKTMEDFFSFNFST